jgi:hypothetical protein
MKPLKTSVALAVVLLLLQSVRAQQPVVPLPAPVVPQALRAPYQSQVIPDAHTPVAIIQPCPFRPIGLPSPTCECNGANKIHLPHFEKPWVNCNCVNCTSFHCEMRFQWGSCQAFFGEGQYDTNYPVTPETQDRRRIQTGGPTNLPCPGGTGGAANGSCPGGTCSPR